MPKCSFCDLYMNIPCETTCEMIECDDRTKAGKPMKLQPGELIGPMSAPGQVVYVPKNDKPDLPDPIDHPEHYSRWRMEPIEFIAINDLPWWLANVIKYTMRYDAKDGLSDLYKARSYLDMKIRQLEGHQHFWEKPVSEERKLNVGAAS